VAADPQERPICSMCHGYLAGARVAVSRRTGLAGAVDGPAPQR
jgi:hypothetical protein